MPAVFTVRPPLFMELLPPSWRRKGAGDRPSSTTALHPPAPAPCAATSAARRAPPPRSRTALGFARSALGARPRVGREGEGAFRTHTSFPFSTLPRCLPMQRGVKKWAPRAASRPRQNWAVLARATGFARTPAFLSAHRRTLSERTRASPVLFTLASGDHMQCSQPLRSIDSGTFGRSRP